MRALPRLRDIPMLLSLSRLVLAAGFVAADGALVRAGLIGVAGVTDLLDGFLARRWKVTTRSGALLDPIGDHVFMLAAAITLVISGALGTRAALVLLARDIATAIGFLVALAVPRLRHEEFKARWPGKLVTAFQFATLLAVVLAPSLTFPLLVFVAVGSVSSIVDYGAAVWRARARAR
ncbi:MAG: CDP-alcohol phosphatidyltransferase family protein [Gemmatimonadota bacterium]|nr:CDP-alcohol phosphatidyltransferase family protein [Gemmatimonadota bacterium]